VAWLRGEDARGDGARTSALGLGLSEVAARWSECTEGHMTEGAAAGAARPADTLYRDIVIELWCRISSFTRRSHDFVCMQACSQILERHVSQPCASACMHARHFPSSSSTAMESTVKAKACNGRVVSSLSSLLYLLSCVLLVARCRRLLLGCLCAAPSASAIGLALPIQPKRQTRGVKPFEVPLRDRHKEVGRRMWLLERL
jgi:hypothetical protein